MNYYNERVGRLLNDDLQSHYQEDRVMLLGGFAIAPQVASEFITAFMEGI